MVGVLTVIRSPWREPARPIGPGRRTLVTVSPAGRKLVRPLLEKARAHESEMLRTLAAPEQAALKKLLAKLAGR